MSLLPLATALAVGFFALAILLWGRAEGPPPMEIRTESGRSQQEHEYRRRVQSYRDGSVACLIAGVVTISVYAALALYSLKGR